MKKIAINGFGRIGRLVFRIIEELDDIENINIDDFIDNVLNNPEENVPPSKNSIIIYT